MSTSGPGSSDVGAPEDGFVGEIANLHSFFEDWFNGRSDRTIDEFSDRLDTGFVIVNPQGHRYDKKQIVDAVVSRTGGYEVVITTRNAVLHVCEPALIGTYIEHHLFKGESTQRMATVSMVADSSRPTGYRWLSVHETWIEEMS